MTVHTSPSEAAGELATAVTNVSAAAPDWSALLAATAAQTVTDVTTVAAGAGVTITQNVVETEAVQSGDWLTRINKPRFYNNGKYVTGELIKTQVNYSYSIDVEAMGHSVFEYLLYTYTYVYTCTHNL